MPTLSKPNPFIWYELMTGDPDAAAKFYGPVVGWNVADSGMPGVHYTLLKAGDYAVGGIMESPQGTEAFGPFWIGYIGVNDVDAACRSITEKGGSIHRPPGDIPNIGRFAVVADPQGASFIVMAPQGEAPPAPPPATPGLIGWRELMTTDWEKALDFYAGEFGWTKDRSHDMSEMGTYQLFALGGGEAYGGMMNDPMKHPPHWNFYFQVDSVDDAAGRVTSNGGKVIMGPMDVPDGSRVLMATDPQGGFFGLVSRAG